MIRVDGMNKIRPDTASIRTSSMDLRCFSVFNLAKIRLGSGAGVFQSMNGFHKEGDARQGSFFVAYSVIRGIWLLTRASYHLLHLNFALIFQLKSYEWNAMELRDLHIYCMDALEVTV